MTTSHFKDTSSCPKQYLKLRAKILRAIAAETPSLKTSLSEYLQSNYECLWKEVAKNNRVLDVEQLFHVLNIPLKGKCKTCNGRTNFNRQKLRCNDFCSLICSNIHPDTVKKKQASYKARTGYNCPRQNPEVVRKTREDYLLKSNGKYDHPFKDPANIARWKNVLMERTGYSNPSQDPVVKLKKISTNRARSGYDYPLQDPKSVLKFQDTYEKKTGYRNPTQNPEVFQRATDSCYKTKVFVAKNGKNHSCRGYEPLVLSKLDQDSRVKVFTTRQGSKLLPTIRYTKPTGEVGFYHPDIGVRLQTGEWFIIEVKSPYTLWAEAEVNRAKFRAASKFAKANGASFWLVCVDAKDKSFTWQTN